MSEEHRKPSFSSTDAVEITEYPRVSRLAVAALLLGLLSFAALTSQLLWCLPVAGMVTAIAALSAIRRAEVKTIGRRAAVIGLALSVTVAAWAPLRYYLRVRILSRQAREYAVEWIEYVQQGRLREAHQLRMEQHSRQPPNTDLAEYYENDELMAMNLKEFTEMPCISRLVEHGDQLEPHFVRDESISFERSLGSKLDIVRQVFLMEPTQGGQVAPFPLSVEMIRGRRHGDEENFWYVGNVEYAAGADDATASNRTPVLAKESVP